MAGVRWQRTNEKIPISWMGFSMDFRMYFDFVSGILYGFPDVLRFRGWGSVWISGCTSISFMGFCMDFRMYFDFVYGILYEFPDVLRFLVRDSF